MAGRSSWTGAITFAGFPIGVKAYPLLKSPSKDGFKTLCECHGEPIAQVRKCTTDDKEVGPDQQRKGVQVAKDVYRTLPEAAIAAIESGERSLALEVEMVCPLETIDLSLSTNAYVLSPDGGVNKKPVEIMRLVLAKLERAIVTRWTPRAGSKDSILVIRAGDGDLLANTLPFAHQLNDPPTPVGGSVMVAPGELAMFEQAMTALYTNGPFDVKAFQSDFTERRQKAIDEALAGQPITAPPAPAPTTAPDLMAALKATLDKQAVAA
jgi:DNA end-binding protein Ku